MKDQTTGIAKKSKQLWAALAIAVVAIACIYFPNVASSKMLVQSKFGSPEEAGKALQVAAQMQDERALAQILGPDSKDILSSGDTTQDQNALASFVKKFDQMNRWVKMTDGSEVLNIGADNYAFPIPLVQGSSKKWHFDTAAGEDEILARRIGRNELLAIDAVFAIANAEEMYAQVPRDGNPSGLYTSKIFSTPGKQDGLYWKAAKDQPASPLGRVDEFASEALATPGETPVIDGYVFRILTAQGDAAKGGAKPYLVDGKMTGGFAIIASPAKYGDSGIMTFIFSQEGVVYQQDLGDDTTKVAASITSYNPTGEWDLAE